MKDLLLHNMILLVLSLFCTVVTNHLNSDFLFNYLEKNLVTILIAFLGVRIATISIIATKLKEIMDKYRANFSTTIKSLRLSIKEQIIYILVAIALSVLNESVSFIELSVYSEEILKVLFTYIFLASIYNLYDTANAVFIIFEWESE